MGININDSNKQVVKSREYYTGIVDYKVVAINPTMEEAEKLGRTLRKEPEYVTKSEDGDHNKLRLDFYIQSVNPEIKDNLNTKITVWLEDKPRTNLAGDKKEVINSKGNTTWVTLDGDGETNLPDWFDKEGLRDAMSGESSLYEVIKGWLNVDPDDNCKLDTEWSKLVAGDLKELNQYLKAAKNNTFSALTGVRKTDSGDLYQEVWNGFIGRTSAYSPAIWSKKLDNPYPEIKFDYQNSLSIKKYEVTLDSEDDESETTENKFAGSSRF